MTAEEGGPFPAMLPEQQGYFQGQTDGLIWDHQLVI